MAEATLGFSALTSPLSSGALTPGNQGGGGFLQESNVPGQFQDIEREVPDLTQTADALKGYGGALTQQGTSALQMAQNGQLTPEQQAQLGQYQTGLTNQARQQFYNMGRTPDQDTAFINQTGDIDAQVNAMAQQQIQTTIQLGLGELSSGSSFFGQSLGFDNAALGALSTAGQAQLQEDEDYSKSLTSAFSAIGSLFGTIGGAVIGGPVGASIGGALGGAAGGALSYQPNPNGGGLSPTYGA